MSGSNRDELSKTGLIWAGILATLFVVGLTVAGYCVQLGYYQQAAHQAAQHHRWAKDEIRSGCPGLASKTKAECAYQAIKTAHENERQEYDLYAQRTSALWAGVMAVAALFGIGLSGVGVFLVYGTWNQTAEAAESTRKTLRSYIAKERALLVINGAERASNPEFKQDGFVVKLINGGLAPGTITVTHWSYLQARKWPEAFNQFDNAKRTLAQDGDGRTPLLYWPGDLMGYWPFLVGLIEYETLGERYSTPFGFLLEHHAGEAYQPDWWSAQECYIPGMPDHT